jgi:hypothetical protein
MTSTLLGVPITNNIGFLLRIWRGLNANIVGEIDVIAEFRGKQGRHK